MPDTVWSTHIDAEPMNPVEGLARWMVAEAFAHSPAADAQILVHTLARRMNLRDQRKIDAALAWAVSQNWLTWDGKHVRLGDPVRRHLTPALGHISKSGRREGDVSAASSSPAARRAAINRMRAQQSRRRLRPA